MRKVGLILSKMTSIVVCNSLSTEGYNPRHGCCCVTGVGLSPRVPSEIARLLYLKEKEFYQRHMIRRRIRDSILRKEQTPEKWE